MSERKVSVQGIRGPVLKDLRTPLELLAQHELVKKINADRTLPTKNRAGKRIEVRNYDEARHTLMIRGYVSGAAQNMLILTDASSVETLRGYIEELNRRYLRK